MTDTGTVGVILLNLGGPDTPEAIRPFLYNLFSDRQIIRLGPALLQKPIAWMIARRRAPKTTAYYQQIGGASPIVKITRQQALALEQRLREHGDFRVLMGMRYWHPFNEEAVLEARTLGVQRVIALTLYPHYSVATTGSSEVDLRKYLLRHGYEDESVAYISQWFDHPLYVDALADLLRKGMSKVPADTHVLFSAHSLPQSFIDEGDPYVKHVMATIAAVQKRVKMPSWSLGYQSRSGPVQWLTPSSDDEIRRLAGSGEKNVLVVPISFVNDHIETLYEIDIQYRELAAELGVTLTRTESLNVHPLFIRALEDLTMKTARERAWV